MKVHQFHCELIETVYDDADPANTAVVHSRQEWVPTTTSFEGWECRNDQCNNVQPVDYIAAEPDSDGTVECPWCENRMERQQIIECPRCEDIYSVSVFMDHVGCCGNDMC